MCVISRRSTRPRPRNRDHDNVAETFARWRRRGAEPSHDDGAHTAARRTGATSAAVTRFRPEHRMTVRRPHSLAQLLPHIELALADDAAVAALRIDGWFSFVRVQVAGAAPSHEFSDVMGTIVGFRNADVGADDSNRALRLHFIDERRQIGGRVADFEVLRAHAELARVAPVSPRA
jgi:alpha-acetolactate decarboxylase